MANRRDEVREWAMDCRYYEEVADKQIAETVLANRRKFETEHYISKTAQYCREKFNRFLWHNDHGMMAGLDHQEMYHTRDGYVIWISSVYPSQDSHEYHITNTVFGVPFVETDILYYNGGVSYYKKFPRNTRLRKEDIEMWNWKMKAERPKCGMCKNDTDNAHYNVSNNKWSPKRWYMIDGVLSFTCSHCKQQQKIRKVKTSY
jgi:hypothetical protein